MHAICGTEDKNATSIATNLTCWACAPAAVGPHQAGEEFDDDDDGAKKPAAKRRKKKVVTAKPSTEESQNPISFTDDQLAQSPAKNTRSASRTNSPPAKSTTTRRSSSFVRRSASPQETSRKRKSNILMATKKMIDPSKKLKKSSQQKSFTLSSDKRKPDPLVMKRVAFDVEDGGYGADLLLHFGGKDKVSISLSNDRYLLGTIKCLSKRKRSPVCYEVDWEDLRLGFTEVELAVLIPAIELSEKLKRQETRQSLASKSASVASIQRSHLAITRKIFGSKVHDLLQQTDDGDEGTPNNSDMEAKDPYLLVNDYDSDDTRFEAQDTSADSDDFHLEDMRKYASQLPYLYSSIETINNSNRQSDRFRWSSEASLRPPSGLSNRRKSCVRPEMASCFNSPLSSFLAFVPPKIFKSIASFSNAYAHRCMEESGKNVIVGGRWKSDITFTEIMQFFGILFHMVLRPAPGNSYIMCWNDQQWHPYTAYMPLRRFQQIRSVLHFNEPVDSTATPIRDALYKVRPLLNILKITFPSYLRLGDNFALDEASVASRSRYGADIIFYNPTKPGGKYHFRFYLLCCSTTYACIRLRMHTKNNTDFGDGFFEAEQELQEQHAEEKNNESQADEMSDEQQAEEMNNDQEDAEEKIDEQHENNSMVNRVVEENPTIKAADSEGPVMKKLVMLVLDMCKPLFGTGCVVNMDNYYTSPEAAVALREKGVFMRGTCRPNRFGFPSTVRYSNTEANNQGRGSIKRMVDTKNHLAAYGWVDGNPVHFLTSADGTGSTEVKRRVGRTIARVKAPNAIKQYNQYMHAVDRHDQLRDTFSLSKRHGFKKYYLKIALGLIDMAAVNAWIHYKLVNKKKCEKESARCEFMKSLADSLLVTDWATYTESASAKENERVFRSLFATSIPESSNANEDDVVDEIPKDSVDDALEVRQRICTPVAVRQFLKTMNRSKNKGFCCQVCAFEGRGQNNVRDVVICTQHRLRLCTVVRDDEKSGKRLGSSKGNEVLDTLWRAPDGMSCWQKAHDFYIPNGLFLGKISPFTDEEMEDVRAGCCIKFQNIRTSCEIYKKKHMALGTLGRKQRRGKNARAKSGQSSTGRQQKHRHILVGAVQKTRVEDVEMRILGNDDDSVSIDSTVSASVALQRHSPMALPPTHLDEDSHYESAIQGGETAEI